jgi:FkbM family methyltransferase
MKIGNRHLWTITGAVLQRRHYMALANMFRLADSPVKRLLQYLFRTGEYPQNMVVKTANQPVSISLYCHDDLLTLNEIFFRKDYATANPPNPRVIVDFGSNIGISAAFFLSEYQNAFAYLFEPLPQNIERLRQQLSVFEGRYKLDTRAVAPKAGVAEFGWEPTGRYGGIGRPTVQTMEVRCVSANEALSEIIRQHGHVDILKVDIESLEQEIVAAIPAALMCAISTIYVETKFTSNPHARTHFLRQRGPISEFTLRESSR